MKANKYISESEHKLLLTFAFISFVLAYSNFAYQIVDHFTKPKALFEFYDMKRASFIPLFNFLTLFIFIALFKSKRYTISSLLTLFSFVIFGYEFYRGVKILVYTPIPELNIIEKLLLIANYFDYIVFLIVSILLFWQISILLRMLVKTLQTKNELP